MNKGGGTSGTNIEILVGNIGFEELTEVTGYPSDNIGRSLSVQFNFCKRRSLFISRYLYCRRKVIFFVKLK